MRFLLCLIVAALPVIGQRVEFRRDVRPILSDRCFACHGPDAAQRQANLRLDMEQDAKKVRGAKVPISAGSPDKSEVMRRISSDNAAVRMPPVYSGHKKLSDREIATIKRWIEQGASWQTHWSFVAPVKPVVPAVRDAKWIRNPIDAFILARLEKENLHPSSPATKEQLIRRVSLDLTGLPASTKEVEDFLKDDSSQAYEKVVDRLLASPRYGERLAVDWLDAARYADTHGYQVDPEKEMWAWRDWVIQAFNRNQPFDQFTVEQLAGDLLPSPTLPQLVATGFQRNLRVNTEAGSIAGEFQMENVVDRISTMGTVWLGLTIGCARCHDHKFDPITAKDFYSLYSFFNNVPEIGTGGPRDGRGNLTPYLKLPTAEQSSELADVEAKVNSAKQQLKALDEHLAAGQAEWEKSALTRQPVWKTLQASEISSKEGVTLTRLADGSYFASGKHPLKDAITFTTETDLRNITGIRLELLPDSRLPSGGSGRGANGRAVITQFDAKVASKSKPDAMRKLELGKITATFSSAESMLIRLLQPMTQLARGWSVEPELDKPHFAVIEPRSLTGFDGGTKFQFTISNDYGDGQLIGRFCLSVTNDEFPDVPSKEIMAILKAPADSRSDEDRETLRGYFVSHPFQRRVAAEELARLVRQRTTLENKIPSTMVMKEMSRPRDAFVLVRGQYDKRGEQVRAAVPSFLPTLPQGAPVNRLGLAKWIVSAENPLTSRVTVNRFWQSYFGTGLVKTAEDFGSQGEAPSHPELLDWLATEFVRSGWDVKAMQKLIVMSATYRQSSKASPQLMERDPENRLLARGARFRLSAEMIRDQALFVSGLLKERIGGPPTKPYQPDGLWEQLSVIDDKKLYERSKGDDLWRRSVYTYWKRTVPPPSMMTFDAPTREFCVVRRSRSSTPLQALAVLNDETYVEASRILAERMLRDGGANISDRIAFGFRLATDRIPSAAEVSVLSAGLERRLVAYRKTPESAAKLLSAGEAPSAANADKVELAAYTTLASVLLNLDEVLTKQ